MKNNTFFKAQKLVSNSLKQVLGGTIFEFFSVPGEKSPQRHYPGREGRMR